MSQSDEEHNREAIVQVGTMLDDVFAACGVLALESITVGSELTGAPGQPVDTGNLRNSWQMEREGKNQIVIGTNVIYAESIEDGLSYAHGGTPMKLRSTVGGFRSVAHTTTNFDRIIEHAKELVLRGGDADAGARRG